MTVTSVLKAAMNFNDMIIDSVKFITQDNVRKGEVFKYSRIDIHAHMRQMVTHIRIRVVDALCVALSALVMTISLQGSHPGVLQISMVYQYISGIVHNGFNVKNMAYIRNVSHGLMNTPGLPKI